MGERVLFFLTTVKERCVSFSCGVTMATARRCNVERHFTTRHENYNNNYPPGSTLRSEKVRELKTALDKRQSFFTKSVKKSRKATEVSFRAVHFLVKKKKVSLDGEVFKEAMIVGQTWWVDFTWKWQKTNTRPLLSHRISVCSSRSPYSADIASNRTLNVLCCFTLKRMPSMIFPTGVITCSKPITIADNSCW